MNYTNEIIRQFRGILIVAFMAIIVQCLSASLFVFSVESWISLKKTLSYDYYSPSAQSAPSYDYGTPSPPLQQSTLSEEYSTTLEKSTISDAVFYPTLIFLVRVKIV